MKKNDAQYEMDILRTIIQEELGVEIVKRTNKRHAVNGRKLFSKILCEIGVTKSEIGRYLRKDHSTIVHYMADADSMIKYTEGMLEKYEEIRREFLNVVKKTINEDNKSIVILKLRIDELISEKKELSNKLNELDRLKKIIRFIDTFVPDGQEDIALEKIMLTFNKFIYCGKET